MNLPKFLKETDQAADRQTKEQLAQFIHSLARKLPAEKRNQFLAELKNPEKDKTHYAEEKAEWSDAYDDYKEKIINIEDGEWELDSSIQECYDSGSYNDWYDKDETEYTFQDPNGIVRILTDACQFIHHCVDSEHYQAAYELAMMLITLEVTVTGEYSDYVSDTISLEELEEQGLCTLNLDRLIIDAAYAAYSIHTPSERPKAMYDLLGSYCGRHVTLEMVLQSGEELPDTDAFFLQWVMYLGEEGSDRAAALLKEALELSNDPQLELEAARKYHPQHPRLYMQYIENNTGTTPDENLLEAAKEALDAIGVQYIARSETALCLSRIALRLGRQREAELGWLEAFRSDSGIVNYLRLRVECEDYSKVRTEVTNICNSLETRKTDGLFPSGTNLELRENLAANATVHYLSFLQERFTYVMEHVMNVKEALGWSYTFMKKGLALYLLLLYKSANLNGKGCLRMCKIAAEAANFKTADYEKGLLKKTEQSDEALFWQCFCSWKKTVSLTDEDWHKYLHWVEQLVEKRVRGIMEANRRNYYEECAAFVAALGEVRESIGNPSAAQHVMTDYKKMFPRRSAFHRELRAYGMYR